MCRYFWKNCRSSVVQIRPAGEMDLFNNYLHLIPDSAYLMEEFKS